MKDNFNSVTLLCTNEIIILGKHNEEYIMHLPVLKDKIENLDYDIFITFCATSVEEFNKANSSNFKSKLSIFKYYKKNNIEVIKTFEKFLTKYMIGFQYVDDSLFWGKRLVSKEIFETFCNYCAIAGGVKSIEDLELIITEDMDEFEKKRILAEQKIKKTKAKNNNENTKNTGLDIILTGVVKEFGYKYKELYNMTLYSIYFMYSQLNKISGYLATTVAAGNGLLKQSTKYEHWAYSNQ